MRKLLSFLACASLLFGQTPLPNPNAGGGGSSSNIPAFTGQPLTIVFDGSSTCAGTGASVPANSWTAKLTAALPAYKFFNVSVPGRTISDLIANFYTEVVPKFPKFVVLCSSIYNETGGAGGPSQAAWNTYTSNLSTLFKMIESIGATPIVAGQMASTSFTAAGCAIVKDLYAWYQAQAVVTFDFLNPVADPATNCHIQAALDFGDGIHVNDAGMAALFAAVPLTTFDVSKNLHQYLPTMALQSYLYGTDIANIPLSITFPAALSSWTLAEWVRDAGTGSIAIASWTGSTGPLRIRNSAPQWELIGTGVDITSAVNGTQRTFRRHMVSYNYPSNTLAYYIDGALVGTGSPTQFQATAVAFLGRADSTASNCQACYLAAPAIWQTSLNAQDAADDFNGKITTKSLLFYSALPETPRTDIISLSTTSQLGTVFTGTGGFASGGIFTQNFQSPLLGGHILTYGSAPVPSSCGGSPAVTGDDIRGTVTEGTVATGCTITFAAAYTAAPSCNVSSQGGLVFSYAVSASAIVITNVGALSSTKLDYNCKQ